MHDLMPLLKEICSGGKHYDDIVLLNINHDLKNVYVFSALLAEKFGKVVQISASYSPSFRSDRLPFENGVYYYSNQGSDGAFVLSRCEESLNIKSPDIIESMDMLITIAITRDILPEIKKGKKLFILEDGGYHSTTLDNLEQIFPDLSGKIIGSVEQTTSGTKILSSRTAYNYPSISIARSEVKMCLESVFIGQRIVEELSSFIAYINNFLNFSDILVIGYGIFGRAVVKKLDGYKCRITVCDSDAVIREAAVKEGCKTVEKISSDVFRNNQIIIAMTGNRSFGIKELEQYFESDADNIILSSGSSKDIEFKDILCLIQDPSKQIDYKFRLEETGPFFDCYSVSNGKETKHFTLIAKGMPVNFSREGSLSLTDKVIDLIFAEMTECAIEIIESKTPLENKLYLLGDVESPVRLDEKQIIEEWFKAYNLTDGNHCTEDYLEIHPCKDYLRKSTFRKQSVSSLI